MHLEEEWRLVSSMEEPLIVEMFPRLEWIPIKDVTGGIG
jgi:hypothetical protein